MSPCVVVKGNDNHGLSSEEKKRNDREGQGRLRMYRNNTRKILRDFSFEMRLLNDEIYMSEAKLAQTLLLGWYMRDEKSQVV